MYILLFLIILQFCISFMHLQCSILNLTDSEVGGHFLGQGVLFDEAIFSQCVTAKFLGSTSS